MPCIWQCVSAYLVAVAMHIALASKISGHFVAFSNQFPNCSMGSKDTSWLSLKHCKKKKQKQNWIHIWKWNDDVFLHIKY